MAGRIEPRVTGLLARVSALVCTEVKTVLLIWPLLSLFGKGPVFSGV